MKILVLAPRVLAACALFFLFSASAPAYKLGYVVDSSGDVAYDGFGDCLHTRDWRPELAIPECGGKKVAKAEPKPGQKDSDGDGVLDNSDRCPNTPRGTRVDVRGCALKGKIELRGVNFQTGSARLTPSSHAVLDETAATLKKNADVKAEVAGHTDSQGSRAYNISLSQRRAAAVRKYLIDQGVNATNLTARGYGPDRPVASNSTRAGRAQNRRVELVIKK